MTTEPQGDKKEKEKGRGKKASSGAWNWFKSKRGSNALLATIAGAVATGLAVAGIIVPLNDLKSRMGVVESHSRFDPILDHLEAIDDSLSAIQKADPVGAMASLAPQVKELGGQIGDIRASLSGTPATPTGTPAVATALPAAPTQTTLTPATVAPGVLARLDAAESKLTQLSTSLAAQQETTRTLSTAVGSIRSDIAAVRAQVVDLDRRITAAQAGAEGAQAAAEGAQAAAEAAVPVLRTFANVVFSTPATGAEKTVGEWDLKAGTFEIKGTNGLAPTTSAGNFQYVLKEVLPDGTLGSGVSFPAAAGGAQSRVGYVTFDHDAHVRYYIVCNQGTNLVHTFHQNVVLTTKVRPG